MFKRTGSKRGLSVFSVALVVVTLLSACGQGSQGPTAASLMPSLSGYQANDTLNIQDAITKIGGVASIGTGQPEVAAALAAVNGLVTCYQQAGAVQGRTYVNSADALKAGVIVIVDRNVVTNPQTFLNCVLPKSAAAPLVAGVQPCAKAYTLSTSNNQFYIAYAATSTEVCQAFCSGLQGCTP